MWLAHLRSLMGGVVVVIPNAGASNWVRARWFWAALAVAVAAPVAGPAVLAGAQDAAEADAEPGEVSGVRLWSDAAGELSIAWDEPDPAPTDYRVTWAPAGGDWLSFSADDEADRGNAYPTATTLTLSGLGGGGGYKVRLRARYHDGDNALSPWSGPWTDAAQLRVRAAPAAARRGPPAAPTGLSAVERAGRVVLDWDDPPPAGAAATASTVTKGAAQKSASSWSGVTGYRVLRGATAKKLATIANNTRSTDTGYTDTTAEPGTTYHYAIVALNAQGPSPRSATAKITTKPADQQQITTRGITKVGVLNGGTGTTPHTTSFASAATGQAPRRIREIAVPFTTGTQRVFLSHVGLKWSLAESITLRIHGDDNGKPKIEGPGTGVVDGSLLACTAKTSSTFAFSTVDCGRFALSPSTKYWVVFSHNGALSLDTTPDAGEGSEGLSGWTIGDNFYHKLGDADTWTQHDHTLRTIIYVRNRGLLNEVKITSSPRYETGYEVGEYLAAEFGFSRKAFYEGGVAAFWLIDGDGNASYRSGLYHSGSGIQVATTGARSKLTYRYQVKPGDVAAGGFSVGSDPLGNAGVVDSADDTMFMQHAGVDGSAAHAVRGVAAECSAGVVYCGRAELVPNSTETGGEARYWRRAESLRTKGSLSRRGFSYLQPEDFARSGTHYSIDRIEADSSSNNVLSLDIRPELNQGDIDSLTLVIDRNGKQYDFSDATIKTRESTFGGNFSDLVWHNSGQDWRDLSRVDFRIVSDLLVSNDTFGGSEFSDIDSRDHALASMFRTGGNPRGYAVDTLSISFSRSSADPASIPVRIHSNVDGSPGEPLATFTASGITNNGYLIGTKTGDALLRPNEAYWVVVENLAELRQIAISQFQCPAGRLDPLSRPGWGFGSQILARRDGAWTQIVDGRVLCVKIRGGPPRSNVAAAGGPVVRGVAEEGFPLHADLGGIVDPNGLPDPSRRLSEYSFQWFRVDGAVEAPISGATSQTYVAQAGDVGKRLKVTVGVTDLAGHAESVSSGLSAVVGPAAGVVVANARAAPGNFRICTNEAAGEAVSVSTGDRAVVLHAVRIALAAKRGAVPQIKIFSDASGLPGTDLHTMQDAAAFDNIAEAFEEFESSGFTLEANTIYWVVYGNKAQDPDGSGSVCGDTTLDVSEDPGGFAGWSIGNATAELDGVWGVYPPSFGVPRIALIGAYPTDAPDFAQSSRNFTVAEGAAGGTVVGTAAARYDGEEALVYAVGGADAAAFANSFDLAAATGQITVKAGATVDFEVRSVYSVTVSVSDGVDEFGEDSSVVDDSIPVWVTVANADEDGSLALSVTSPVVGEPVSGTVSDPDGGVRNVTWQWSRADTAAGVFADISGATSASYVPGRGDSGKFLRATAVYEDRHGPSKTVVATAAERVVSVASNSPPSFPPLFTVAERAPAGAFVGDASATDPDGDPLTYTVSGADAAAFSSHFEILPSTDANPGRIVVKQGADIDYQTRSLYSVTVHVSDRKSASGAVSDAVDASMPVRIVVRNADEPGSVALSAMEPLVDVQMSASIVDDDGDVRDVSWEWMRGDSRTGAFAPISGAVSAVYRPVRSDAGKYLKARAAYSDGHLGGKSAEGVSEHAVRDRQSRQERAGVTVSSLD